MKHFYTSSKTDAFVRNRLFFEEPDNMGRVIRNVIVP